MSLRTVVPIPQTISSPVAGLGLASSDPPPLPDFNPLSNVPANFFWEVRKTSGDGPVNTWLYSAERMQNILYLIGSDFRQDYGQVMFLDLNSMAWDEKKV